jgi:hypothetical protein
MAEEAATEPAAPRPVTHVSYGGVATAEPATATSVSAATKVLSAAPAPVHPATWAGLALAGILTLALGIVPMWVIDWALAAAQTLIK